MFAQLKVILRPAHLTGLAAKFPQPMNDAASASLAQNGLVLFVYLC